MFQETIITPLNKPYSLLQGLGNRPVCDGAFIISCKMEVQEIWKDVIGYEGIYQISNFGNVKSLNYRDLNIESLMKPTLNTHGYLTVCLSNRVNLKKRFQVHRLVAMAFIDNPKNKPEVNHKNGVRKDNIVSNLEWVTRSENTKHAYEFLNHQKFWKGKVGCLNPCSKKVDQYDLFGNYLKTWESATLIQTLTGMYQANISATCNGRYKSMYGYIWKWRTITP